MTRNPGWRGVAVDLGASGGKVFMGGFDGKRLFVTEVYRFLNQPVKAQNTLYWDILNIYSEVKEGVQEAHRLATRQSSNISTIGCDSWAVDFGLLDAKGQLLGNPVHYRDARTKGVMEGVQNQIGKETLFHTTGIQFLPFNTVYQLVALQRAKDSQLEQASRLLLIPDLLQYFMTGIRMTEFTNATTTQLFDPLLGDWSWTLMRQLNLPEHIFSPINLPGTEIYELLPDVSEELGNLHARFVSVATHDTASAVVAVPTTSANFAYISCGTWSLLGTQVTKPNLSAQALEWNFTNEGAINGSYRLLKNIMGLWLLQELTREWEYRGQPVAWDDIVQMTGVATPFRSLIDPDDPRFLAPGDMFPRIAEFCHDTNQPVPQTKGAVVRCILESLVLKHRWTLERLEKLQGCRLPVVHMVGGGIQNQLLSQWTANACGRLVVAGPIEASGAGNLIVQLMALGEIATLREGRELIQRSYDLQEYEPMEVGKWDIGYERFKRFLN